MQYADDTTLLLHGDNSLNNCVKQIKKFEQAAGAKINTGKSEGIWLGSYKSRADSPHGFKWHNKSLKILGLYFGTEKTKTLNWKERITKFIKILNLWSGRDLSFRGKAVVVNQLATILPTILPTILRVVISSFKQHSTTLPQFKVSG